MKAVQISRFGGPEVLETVDLPTPVPGPGQVLVRVRAAGVNFVDTLMREDRYAVTPPLPSVLGAEAAGTVEAFGAGVEGGGVKGLVCGMRVAVPLFAGGVLFGGYADHVLAEADSLVPLPDGLSYEAAAALMVQGLTALHLTRQAPPEGKSVLISAAGGGVGSLLVQLAKRAGARQVIAAASTAEKLSFAEALGADGGVDYSRPDWPERLRELTGGAGADIIYESVGGAVTREGFALLAPLGQMVIYGALNIQDFQFGVADLTGLIFGNQSLTGMSLVPLLTRENLRQDLAELFGLALSGEIKTAIGGRYALEEVGEAHRRLSQRGSTGKLVLVP